MCYIDIRLYAKTTSVCKIKDKTLCLPLIDKGAMLPIPTSLFR